MQAPLFGVLNLYKQRGMTSHDAVVRVRRFLGERRIGHGGTLDPEAEGVLPLLVGRATRLAEFVLAMDKSYRAVMTIGTSTDTHDAQGRVVASNPDCSMPVDDLDALLQRFTGALEQIPPMVSAVRQGGRRLYQLSRAGKTVSRPPRPITIHGLTVGDMTGIVDGRLVSGSSVELYITCSKGTYIRTLIHDIGQAMQCGAHMSGLIRTQVGPLTVADAYTIRDTASAQERDAIVAALAPPETVLAHWPRLYATREGAENLRFGRSIPAESDGAVGSLADGASVVVLGTEPDVEAHTVPGSRLVCIGRYDLSTASVHPVRVF